MNPAIRHILMTFIDHDLVAQHTIVHPFIIRGITEGGY